MPVAANEPKNLAESYSLVSSSDLCSVRAHICFQYSTVQFLSFACFSPLLSLCGNFVVCHFVLLFEWELCCLSVWNICLCLKLLISDIRKTCKNCSGILQTAPIGCATQACLVGTPVQGAICVGKQGFSMAKLPVWCQFLGQILKL